MIKSAPTLQNIPPTAARLCLEVERFCLTRLGLAKGSRLLLALSGGADSTALAVVLHLLAPRLRLSLHALSVDHGLRDESAQDAVFTLQVCNILNIPCTVRQADVRKLAENSGTGIEDAAGACAMPCLSRSALPWGPTLSPLGITLAM